MNVMAEPYRFGRFTLDRAEKRLRANGVPVRLGSTAFNVLLALVEGAGAVVSKDELMSRVWGYSDVGDNRLHVHINALRKLIGDDYIVTEQKRGYRFAAKLQKARAKTLPVGMRTGNLPPLQTAEEGPNRLIGRATELRSAAKLLLRGRLLTLTGPGGVGKTRLALAVANEVSGQFSDGAWLVELAALNDTDLVPGAVAAALGIKVGAHTTPLDALTRHLAQKTLLIVLDNCEHLIAAAAGLCETLLAAAPGAIILATSREALSCSGEQAFGVPPLEVPHEGATHHEFMRTMSAVELFEERAKGAAADFRMDDEDVPIAARICRRLDGLPLAIEMVSGWAGVLGLKALDAEFDGPAHAWLRAGNTAPPRQATLRATLEWSHDLLSATEQIVLRRLAVFAGGFTLQAARAVTGDGGIPQQHIFECVGSLIRKSMIAVVPGTQRYRLLETTRAFMLIKFAASDEAEMVRQRHARYVLQTLETAMDEWETTSDAVWLERYAPVLDDLRAALDWAMDEKTDDAVALAGASWPLWRELSLYLEGLRRLSAAATLLRPDTPPALEARLRRGLGNVWLSTTTMQEVYEESSRAANLYRLLGKPTHLGSVLISSAYASLMLGRTKEAEQAMAEAVGFLEHASWSRTLSAAYSIQLCIEARLGNYEAARAAGEKATRLSEMVGAERTALVVAMNLAETSLETGDIDDAISAARPLAERLRNTSHSGLLGYTLSILSGALTMHGDLDEALAAAREAAPLLRCEGTSFLLIDHLALRAVLAGRITSAALLNGYVDAVYRNLGREREPVWRQAVESLMPLLRNALLEQEIAQLNHEGALLAEDQALTLALHG